MEIMIASKENLSKAKRLTWQNNFPEKIKCECGGEALLAFVAYEYERDPKDGFVCNLYKEELQKGDFWLHDAMCVAVYFCKGCLNPISRFNQA